MDKTHYTYSPLYNKLLTVTVNSETGDPFQTRSFTYDELGRLTGTVTPEEGSISYSGYNVFGKPGSKIHGSKTIQFIYDDLGREVSRSQSGVAGSTISTSWGTSGINTGKITEVTTGDATNGTFIEFDYDAKTGQPGTKTQTVTIDGTPVEKTVTYSYNDDATVQAVTFPQETMSGMAATSRVLTIGYAPNQYPSALSLHLSSSTYTYNNNLVSNASYDATGGMAYSTGDGLRSEYATDNLGRLSDIIHGKTGSPALLEMNNYDYDVRGNILSYDLDQYDPVVGSTRTLDQSYDYDIYDRLTDAQYVHTNGGFNQQMWEEGFGYDAVGNMTSKSFDNYSSFTFGSVQTFAGKAYDSKNQDPGMDYDSFGNVTSLNVPDKASPLNLAYNGYNQVISVTEGDNLLEYMYDGEGKRVFKRVSQGGTPVSEHIFVRDLNGNILEEITREYDSDTETWSNWKWARDYYYFGDKLISSASAE